MDSNEFDLENGISEQPFLKWDHNDEIVNSLELLRKFLVILKEKLGCDDFKSLLPKIKVNTSNRLFIIKILSLKSLILKSDGEEKKVYRRILSVKRKGLFI